MDADGFYFWLFLLWVSFCIGWCAGAAWFSMCDDEKKEEG